MEFERLAIPDVVLISAKRHGDSRGFFSETWRDSWLVEIGIATNFIQDNHARSLEKNVLRGLHFQFGPAVQTKLVRASKGAILDVAVDIRHGSPTFGKHVAVELSADNWQQLLVPAGFAHGYWTLTEDTEVIYKVDNYYSPEHDAGIRWNDPSIGIDWPAGEEHVILSGKDKTAPLLADSPTYFKFRPDHPPFNVECLSPRESPK